MNDNKIIIFEFGTESSNLIAEVLNNNNVNTEIVPHDISAKAIYEKSPRGIIFSDGNVVENIAIDSEIFTLKIPILGIAYGMQYIVRHFGGAIDEAEKSELREEIINIEQISNRTEMFGKLKTSQVTRTYTPLHFMDSENPKTFAELSIFYNIKNRAVWLNNSKLTKLPQGFDIISKSTKGEICVIADFERNIYAMRFHPKVKQNECGAQIISNFARYICGCRENEI